MCKLYVVLISELFVSVLACCMNRACCLCCWLPLLFFSLIWLEISLLSSSSFILSVFLCFFSILSPRHSQKSCMLISFQATLVYLNWSKACKHGSSWPCMHNVMKHETKIWLCCVFSISAGPAPSRRGFRHNEVDVPSRARHFLMMLSPSSMRSQICLIALDWLSFLVTLKGSESDESSSPDLGAAPGCCIRSVALLRLLAEIIWFPMATAASSFLLESRLK